MQRLASEVSTDYYNSNYYEITMSVHCHSVNADMTIYVAMM